ncbi:MAG: S8 family serine peptidase [Planctomycetota bacterium]|nr:S8 family serine peptidase [Planctomycetota bacterium]
MPIAAQEILPVEGAITFAEANRRAALPRWLSLKYGDFDTTGATPAIPADLRSAPSEGDAYHVVQLAGPVTEAQKAALRARGLDLLDYVPNNAFMVRGTPAQVAASMAAGEIVWSSPLHPAWRIDPMLLKNPLKGRVTVLGFDGVPAAKVVAQLEAAGAVVAEQNPVDTRWLIVANVAQRDLKALARCEDVQWVEAESVVTPRNNQMVWTVQSGASGQTPIWNQGLHGEGQIIGHMDGGLNSSSCYFSDPSNPIGPNHRKIVYRSGSTNGNTHGMHTAGTACGDAQPVTGSTSNRGIAYMAKLAHSADYSASVFYTRATTHRNNGARLHTNSWGNDGTTAYNSHCNAIDLFQWNFEDNLIFFAETNTSTLRNPENAKNLVAVGNGQNGNSANSKCGGGVGPTADGRQKPDLFTPGCSLISASTSNCGTTSLTGTSMACPGATGAAALVRQYFMEGYYPTGVATPGNALTPTNALMKAVLLNTCRDMTGVGGYPNNTEGWGRVVLDDSLYFNGDSDKLWVFDQRRNGGVTTGDVRPFQVQVLSSSRPLEVTLCFTDYAGTVNASDPVVNNLNLVVTAPNGAVYRGNIFSGGWSTTGGTADLKNNVERVAIQVPQVGAWTFEVRAPSVPTGPCGFAICATGDVDAGAGYASFLPQGQGCAGSINVPVTCPEMNPNGGTLEGDLRDNEYCYRASANTPVSVVSFDIFTRSTTGGNLTRPAHIYPDAGGVPGATPIASTTVVVGPQAQFYTATFSTPVPVSGTFYLGLDSSSNNVVISSLTAGATGVGFYRDQVNGPQAWTQSGLVDRPSYRVNCTGAGTFLTPVISAAGLPQLGATYSPRVTDALPTTPAVLISGMSDAVYQGQPLPLAIPGAPGCDLLVSADVLATTITSPQGVAQSSLTVPNQQALLGVEVFHQWAVWDPSVNSLSIVVSNAGRATVGN